MDNKSKQSPANKPKASIETTKSLKVNIFSVSGLIIIGVIIGCVLTYLLFNNKAHGKKHNNENKKEAVSDTFINGYKIADFKFINPYVLTPKYKKMYYQELANFRVLIENYCVSAAKEQLIEQISFYFRDMTNGLWIGINEKEKFIPASLIKVPIMIAVFQKAEKDSSYLKKKLVYKGSFTETYLKEHPEIDDIRTTMKLNESYTVEELVELMITKSDNESAQLLIEDMGMAHWQALQVQLSNRIPIDAPSATNIITTKKYSSFFRMLYNASILNRVYSEKALELLSRAEYKKGIRLAVPEHIRVAHKYGERDTIYGTNDLKIQQLHHAGIVYYPGKPFFICVMIKGTDKQKMEKIIYDIAKITFDQVENQVKLLPKPKLEEDID